MIAILMSEHWEELSEEDWSGHEYQNVVRGWCHSSTGAEVIVYGVAETGMEDVTDKEWAVQHPIDNEGENTHFFESIETAVDYSQMYINENPDPEAIY